MWTRAEIKKEAKIFLRNNYWKAFIVCLILTFLTSGNYFTASNSRQSNYNVLESEQYGTIVSSFVKYPRNISYTVPIFILIITIGLVIIRHLLEVGSARFFIQGYKEDAKVSYLFSTFNSKEWLSIFKTQLLRRVYIFLWSLLLIIPGIIKNYEYRMVPYILAENPNISTKEALKLSKDMTYGHKFDIFILDLSFIGWYILGLLLVGIGILFVIPYEQATQASLYNVLSNYRLEKLEHTKIDIV